MKYNKIYKSILVIGDFHAPFNHVDAVDFLAALNKKYKFDKVINIGDETDFHAMSYHDSDPDLPSAGYELELAIEELKPLYKLFPNVDLVDSNHGSMVLRKALTNGFPKKVLKEIREVLDAPTGWNWYTDITLNTPLGKVYFCHGKSGTPGRLASQYGMSCVQGHFHEKAQVTYISTPDKLMFDAHTGCLVNDKSLAMNYNKVNPRRPIISSLVILNGIPQIIPMVLNKKGRWVGKL